MTRKQLFLSVRLPSSSWVIGWSCCRVIGWLCGRIPGRIMGRIPGRRSRGLVRRILGWADGRLTRRGFRGTIGGTKGW